ncbi:MAG: carbamoyltransferase family protein, partial [Sciscionella sp.]
EEERFTRRKHNKDSRSAANAAAYCLGHAGIRLDEVNEIAVAWNPHWPSSADHITDIDLIRELLDPAYFGGHTPARLTIIEHHLAHAASAFYLSGFPDAAVLAVDGSGDGVSTSLYHGTETGLRLVQQFPFTQSLGWFYETVAEHLGLGDWTSSGKLMGLAAYGQPTYDLDFLRVGHDDGYLLDLSRYGLPPELDASGDYLNLAYYRRLKHAYASAFTDLGVPAHRRDRRYDRAAGRMVADGAFTPAQANLATSAQRALERCLVYLARSALAETGNTRLCVAGGVGLNCSANGVLHRSSGASDLFVQPAAGDAGCAVGAALECLRRAGHLAIPGPPMVSAALGPSFDDDTIRDTLDSYQLSHTYHGENIAAPVAQAIAAGSVVGWFQGPAECGPRALGHRSILAAPRTPATRDHINREIKRREMWRPLAPSILDTALKDFVDEPGPADFMIVAYPATDHAQAAIPATVHVDGSLRPQAVNDITNPRFAQLLRAVGTETGTPVVLNTSFNTDTGPMVCTPTDALRTYFSTPLDALAIGGFLLTKTTAQS